MAVNVIGTLEPKNNGNFPVVKAKDVWLEDETKLEDKIKALEEKTGDGSGGETDADFVKDFEDALNVE